MQRDVRAPLHPTEVATPEHLLRRFHNKFLKSDGSPTREGARGPSGVRRAGFSERELNIAPAADPASIIAGAKGDMHIPGEVTDEMDTFHNGETESIGAGSNGHNLRRCIDKTEDPSIATLTIGGPGTGAGELIK